MSEIPPLLNEAFERATEHIRWSRQDPNGWCLPIEVYRAIDAEAPAIPTWESATGALVHAWLDLAVGGQVDLHQDGEARMLRANQAQN